MRQPTINPIVSALAWATFVSASLAQSPPQNLLVKTRLIQLDIISGRLTAHRPQFSRPKSFSTGKPDSQLRESLETAVTGRRPSMKYERHNENGYLYLQVISGNEVELRFETKKVNCSSFQFMQRKDGHSWLTIEKDRQQIKFEADSIWHLALFHRDICDATLFPTLESLRPHWRLGETADQIAAGLVELTRDRLKVEQAKLVQLVQALGDPSYVQRRSADRQLRSMGQIGYGFLKRVDPETLNVEQSLRLKNILLSLDSPSGDTADRIIAQLTGDPKAFVGMLVDKDPKNRLQAHLHIERITNQTFDFSAYGADADRKVQIANLKQRLGIR